MSSGIRCLPGLKWTSWSRFLNMFRDIEIGFNTQGAAWHFGTFFDSLARAHQLTSTVLGAMKQADVGTKVNGSIIALEPVLRKSALHTKQLSWNMNSNGNQCWLSGWMEKYFLFKKKKDIWSTYCYSTLLLISVLFQILNDAHSLDWTV